MDKQGEILVKATNVSKKFCRNLKTGMRYGVADISRAMFGIRSDKTRLRKDEFWAVKGINFELRRGECLGLIGRNGAGKSTLLKILNGLMPPDEGSIVMRGRVGALIELGAGFNPLLTGRENIFINGQLLGFTKQEIAGKLDAILEFAEIAEFIDTPVQNYSSGMKVRLGFAVAAQMEPDVLIIDEVLAVGDLGFILKCFNKIDALLPNTAVIFVSHSMPQVSRICSAIIMMESGQSVYNGTDVSKGIDLYYSKFKVGGEANVVFNRDNDAEIISFGFEGEVKEGNAVQKTINHLEDLGMAIHLRVREQLDQIFLAVVIHDKEQRPLGLCITSDPLSAEFLDGQADGYRHYKISLRLPRVNLSKGIYSVGLTVMEEYNQKPILRLHGIGMFQVLSKTDIWPPIELEGYWSKST